MIFKIVFLFVIYSSAIQCCTIFEEDKTGSHLKLANTIVLGKIKKNGNKQFFVSEKPWDKIKFEVSQSTCGGFLLNGDEVIFSSKKSLDELIKSNQPIQVTNGSFSNMEMFSSKINDILAIDELPVGKPNYFWKYCASKSDCISTIGRCGEHFRINKNNKARFENYLKKNKKYKCFLPSLSEEINCVKNFCN